MTGFTKNPNGTNDLLEGDGFFLSYNRRPGEGIGLFSGDAGSDETALCVLSPDGGRKYLILNGDHRVEYAAAVPQGLAACIAVFESRRSTQRSSWSEDMGEGDALNWLLKRAENMTDAR